ncbi:hypothetical protein BC628DRAFT_1324667 [Trametes gibbosa]|nr:hypothetical protein BC628DRAFT_1324667 [Trametes gibbosa]
MPLYQLSSANVRDTTLVDCITGKVVYRTWTPPPSPHSSGASTSRLQEKLSQCDRPTTAVLDYEGQTVAEIVWEGAHASDIRIREDVLKGTSELFDAAFIRVFPDATFLPTRMEYTWRITPDTLTLLDDDDVAVGRLYADCMFVGGRPAPALKPTTGLDYLEFDKLPSEDLLELVVSYLLVSTLRERLYSVTKYVYVTQRKRSIATLRSHATRSLSSLRDNIRRTILPSALSH